MHNDDVERMVIVGGTFDHLLEFGAVVVHGGGTGLDIVGDQRPFLVCAKRADLLALIGDRQIALGLRPGRDTQIGTCPRPGDERIVIVGGTKGVAMADIHSGSSFLGSVPELPAIGNPGRPPV